MALSVDITKKLGSFRLNVKLNSDNAVLALLGASGCGKSVTLRCIAGITTPDEGRIILDGRTLFDSKKKINLPPRKRHVGYLFQQYALFPNMTVRENIGVAIKNKRERRVQTETLLSRFQLTSVAKQRPMELSGGQQQRVALARILAAQPRILLFDEPFSALDNFLKAQLEQELRDMLDTFEGNVVWVSHDSDEVFRNCSRICVLDNGTSKGIVTPEELFANPRSVAAAKLSGCKNIIPAIPNGESLILPCWSMELFCGQKTYNTTAVGLRAHHIRFCGEDDVNAIACQVVRTMDNVFSMIVILKPERGTPDAPTLRMETEKGNILRTMDEKVYVSIAPEDILLLK